MMSSLSFSRSAQRLCLEASLSRYFQVVRKISTHPSLEVDGDSFEAAGLRPAVAGSLRIAFPNVRRPTAMQKKLLRAMTQSRDVLLQDDTGTGKSFAAMLALLSKLPAQQENKAAYPNGKVLNGLLIVPHRDLAYQYLHWIHHMTLPGGDAPSSLADYVQVLVRHVNKSTLRSLPIRMQEAIKCATSDQDVLMHNIPRILIATPNALLELIERQSEVYRVLMPSTVVVDEADALLDLPKKKVSKECRGVPRHELGRHIPGLVRILDRLYPTPDQRVCSDRRERNHITPAAPRPQLVMISATLRNRLRSALFGTFGWVKRGEVLKLIRKRSPSVPAHRLGRSAVHHVLVVSEMGDIRNIAGAHPSQLDATCDAENKDEEDVVFDEDDNDDDEFVGNVDKVLLDAPLAFDPAMLEAVAATFALDVPRIALLVLPATAAVRRVIFELEQLGVNAHPFDLVANDASRAHVLSRMDEVSEANPVLIVATLATIRGIDLPDLSHVFMLGVPEGRSGDAYLHVAGRVGRFGRRGKVVTVLEERREERVGNKAVVRDEPRKMAMLFSRIGVHPTRLAHYP